jgi:hypothetical protein
MRLILFAFVMFCCNTWLSSIVMYPCNGRCLNSCGTKTFSILDYPRSPMDICDHCASSTCGQKRIVLDLPKNLKTITVSFHCTCYDFPSCIMHKIIYLIVGFLQFCLARPYLLKARLMLPCSQNYCTARIIWGKPSLVDSSRVIVINDENQTYFSGPAWIAFAQRYRLTPWENLIL